ncbi:MAG: cation:proton antiporter [Breznakibacter sp.]
MDHLPKLIEDLALILIVGAIITLLFKRIKQPIVLGYIIAGFLVGPHLSLIPTVADTENVTTLAEIGVIFLLFSLGLEFNLKKLTRVGGSSSITAIVEIVFITITGYLLGKALGWSTMDSIFLGSMLASSSTTIIIKAFDDMGIKTKQYAQVVFGVLIVEDIVVILLLVLLPTVAVAQQFAGTDLLFTVLKLFFFLILMVVAGIFILPTFIKKMKAYLNDETLLILSVGLCLGMVILATNVGFSAELGAFIMGFVFAESTSAEKVEHVVKPVKDLFAAVFFVSIGMMIDPAILMEYGWAVLAVSLLTVFGKLISTVGGALLSGQPLKQSVQVGMSMAQIGEFAFIVATLGLSLGVISDFLFPVAVGASAITTFTTPYMIKYSERLFFQIEKSLPPKWLNVLQKYSLSTQVIQTEKSWKKVLKWYISTMVINSIVIIAIIFVSIRFFYPFLQNLIDNNILNGIIGLVVTLGLISPFLWSVMAKKAGNIAHRELWMNAKHNRGPLLVIEFLRVVVGLLLIGFLINGFFPAKTSVFILAPIILVVLFVFSKQLNKFHQRLHDRFLFNLNTKESLTEKSSSPEHLVSGFNLSPWDAHIVELEVGPHADYIGKTLEELSWREKFGVNITYIKRGEELLYAPTRHKRLYPFDRVGIIATDEQLHLFNPIFEALDKKDGNTYAREDIAIQKILVNEHNKLKGFSIRDSGIREKTNGLIIGIERNHERILNPVSTTIFEWGDIVWVVGERGKIKNFLAEQNN